RGRWASALGRFPSGQHASPPRVIGNRTPAGRLEKEGGWRNEQRTSFLPGQVPARTLRGPKDRAAPAPVPQDQPFEEPPGGLTFPHRRNRVVQLRKEVSHSGGSGRAACRVPRDSLPREKSEHRGAALSTTQ